MGSRQLDFTPEPQPPKFIGRGQVYTTQSHTTEQTVYYSFLMDDGTLFCSCPGFKYRGACRHLKEVLGES